MGKEENSLTQAIIEYLTLRGWFAWRQNNNPTPIRQGDRIVGFRKFNGCRGVSDIMATPPKLNGIPQVTWYIETKSEDGKQSEDQKNFEKQQTSRGHVYLLVNSFDEFLEVAP